MATKAKTKAGRATERESSRSQQASNRKKATQTPSLSAVELLEQDHRQVEEWFDAYDQLKGNDKQKGARTEDMPGFGSSRTD